MGLLVAVLGGLVLIACSVRLIAWATKELYNVAPMILTISVIVFLMYATQGG